MMAEESIAPNHPVFELLSQRAQFLGCAEPGSPEWDAFRKDRIGGSEVGAIAGESKYESAYSLWAKKLSLIPEERSENEAMYWGRHLEPVVIDRFERDHPEFEIHRNVGTWVNHKLPFMLANPDAVFTMPDGGLGILEIKTARFPDDWAEGVPRYYQTQVQWYLRCFDLQYAVVAVLIGGSDYREYEMWADKTWQQYDLEMVEQFLNHLDAQTKPDWDGSESTLQAVRAQHPDIDMDQSVELGDLGIYYFNAVERMNEAITEAKKYEAAVLDGMGRARTGLIYDVPTYLRVARNGGKPFLQKKKGQ